MNPASLKKSVDRLLGRVGEGAESVTERRRAARAALDAVAAREAELPALGTAQREAEAQHAQMLEEAGARVVAARRAYAAAADSVYRDRQRLSFELQQTADPLVREGGPVVRWLRDQILHLRRHVGLDHDHLREVVRDTERAGVKNREAHKSNVDALRRADWSAEALPAFTEALERVRELQLQTEVSAAEVHEILEVSLPSSCPCGESFDFAHLIPGAAIAALN